MTDPVLMNKSPINTNNHIPAISQNEVPTANAWNQSQPDATTVMSDGTSTYKYQQYHTITNKTYRY